MPLMALECDLLLVEILRWLLIALEKRGPKRHIIRLVRDEINIKSFQNIHLVFHNEKYNNRDTNMIFVNWNLYLD